jgi:hypothetical protein
LSTTRVTAGGATVVDKKPPTNPLLAGQGSDLGRNADAREAMLAQYALNRARAFEAYFPQQPPPARDTYRNRSQMYNDPYAPGASATSGASGGVVGGGGGAPRSSSHGVSTRGMAKPMTPQMSRQLFERSKNEWERQEEYLQYRQRPAQEQPRAGGYAYSPTRGGGGGAAGGYGGGLAESSGMAAGASTDAFSGPFRSVDVAARSFANGPASTGGAAAASSSYGGAGASPLPVRGGLAAASGGAPEYTAPRFNTPGVNTTAATATPSAAAARTHLTGSHRRAETDFRNAANMDELMNSQMW